MVNDAMHCAQVMSTTPEPYFDPVLVHHRRTCLELVRLLAWRGMVRFTLKPKEKVGLFAVRKDDGLKQRLSKRESSVDRRLLKVRSRC